MPLRLVRLDVGRDQAYPLFQVDAGALRLLCTYAGPGTQWPPEQHVDRSHLGLGGRMIAEANRAIARGPVETLDRGCVAIAKGSGFHGPADRGLVHRSPPADGRMRVLFVVDSAQDIP